MKKVSFALLFTVLSPLFSSAQRYLGISTGNWSGTNALYLNPANIADNRHKFSIDLMSLNVNFNNDISNASIGDLSDLVQNPDKGLGEMFFFDPNGGNKTSTITGPDLELRGPGFMVSLGSKHSIAVTSRLRFMLQAHEIDNSLFESVINDDFAGSDIATNGYSAKAGPFNLTSNAWAELGLSYGAVIFENNKHQVKGGFTVRYLKGAGYFSIVNQNLDLQYYANTDSVEIRNTNFEYGGNIPNLENIADDPMGGLGTGFGVDLGVVYEYRPKSNRYRYDMDGKTGILDRSTNTYLFRVSAAVTDMGSITYKQNNQTAIFGNDPAFNNGVGYIRGLELAENITNFNDVRDYLGTRGFVADTSQSKAAKVGLPTALILGLDYKVYNEIYVNLLYTANLADRGRFGTSYYNQLTVTPRIDTRVFSFAVPVTYNTMNSSMYLGVGLRISGFFIGSDNLLGISNNGGTNFYFGAQVPINRKRPKDRDGDHVSNRMDKCDDVPGTWANKGCPDPDKDGDGILDADDSCPEIAGVASASGCPDADGDGISDSDDNCPQEYGSAGMQGCPDTDGDGIADHQDACPSEAGVAELNGCPDTDKDGIADNKDECPDVPGSAVNNGCPDTDGDGIADKDDKCPNTAGTAENNGCPELSEKTVERLGIIGGAIQFETGKAKVKKVSFVQLDEVVKIMNENGDYNLLVEGHTDNVGKPENNLKLSEERAGAVKAYLVEKGVDAGRVNAKGLGDTEPIADNTTAAGRTKNRRVAMTLSLGK